MISDETEQIVNQIRNRYAPIRKHSFIAIFLIGALLISSTFVLAAILLFGQNIPGTIIASKMFGCNNPSTTTENLVVDETRNGTGFITFVCPPKPGFGAQFYAIQPAIGTFFWHHSGMGGYRSLWIIPSQSVPVEGCHKILLFPNDTTPTTLWSINITASDGGVRFSDGQQAYAYCAEFTTLGSYGPIFVTWSQ